MTITVPEYLSNCVWNLEFEGNAKFTDHYISTWCRGGRGELFKEKIMPLLNEETREFFRKNFCDHTETQKPLTPDEIGELVFGNGDCKPIAKTFEKFVSMINEDNFECMEEAVEAVALYLDTTTDEKTCDFFIALGEKCAELGNKGEETPPEEKEKEETYHVGQYFEAVGFCFDGRTEIYQLQRSGTYVTLRKVHGTFSKWLNSASSPYSSVADQEKITKKEFRSISDTCSFEKLSKEDALEKLKTLD